MGRGCRGGLRFWSGVQSVYLFIYIYIYILSVVAFVYVLVHVYVYVCVYKHVHTCDVKGWQENDAKRSFGPSAQLKPKLEALNPRSNPICS